MALPERIILSIVAAFLSWCATLLVALLLWPSYDWHIQGRFTHLIAILCAVAVGALLWRVTGAPRPGLLKHTMIGAFATGLVGFIAGFVGPIIFEPGANQGPLLGIFFTGPLGFLAGGIGGMIYSLIRNR